MMGVSYLMYGILWYFLKCAVWNKALRFVLDGIMVVGMFLITKLFINNTY